MQEVRASQTDADLWMIAEMDDALARIALATTPAGELPVELGGLCRRLRYHRSSPAEGARTNCRKVTSSAASLLSSANSY